MHWNAASPSRTCSIHAMYHCPNCSNHVRLYCICTSIIKLKWKLLLFPISCRKYEASSTGSADYVLHSSYSFVNQYRSHFERLWFQNQAKFAVPRITRRQWFALWRTELEVLHDEGANEKKTLKSIRLTETSSSAQTERNQTETSDQQDD
jgi:hypothetical protein